MKGIATPVLFWLLSAACPVFAQTGAESRFPRPAFLVEKPTALYRAPGSKPLQTQRAGGPPLPLEHGRSYADTAGGLYHLLLTGEYVLAHTPAAAGGRESKGRPVRLPDSGLKAHTGTDPVRAWSRPDTSGPGLVLPPATSVQPLYAVAGDAPLVRVAFDGVEAWLAYSALVWPAPPAAPAAAAAVSPNRRAAVLLLAEYNRGVERARAYYRETTGTLVEARTLKLVDWDEDGPRLYLGVHDGRLPLQAEAMLLELLRRQLGEDLQVEWP